MVTQPSILPEAIISPIIKMEVAQTKEWRFNIDEPTLEVGVPRLLLHMSYGLCSQVLSSYHILPQPLFIYQFEQPFA
jgi:hypothetical protein